MTKYDRDLLVKCPTGGPSERYYQHIGSQFVRYEEKPGKKKISVYLIVNKSKKNAEVELWDTESDLSK